MRTRRAFMVLLSILLMLSLILSACGSRRVPSISNDKKDPPILGNTPGNLSARGLAVGQGDEIYFIPLDDASAEVYKAKINDDGSYDCKTLKTGDIWVSSSINVVDNWIYCYGAYEVDDAENYESYFAICAMRTDGSKCHTVIEWKMPAGNDDDLFTYSNNSSHYFMVAGEWIYYPNFFDGFKIYAVKTDGSGNHKLNDDFSGYINIVDDQIYYLCAEDNEYFNQICVMKTDGSGRRVLDIEIPTHNSTRPELDSLFGSVRCLNVVGDRIYYFASCKICAAKIDGSHSQVLYDLHDFMDCDPHDAFTLEALQSLFFMNVSEDWIYFSWRSFEGVLKIYALRTDGSKMSEFLNRYTFLAILGDRYIYPDPVVEDGDLFCIAKKGGDQKTRIFRSGVISGDLVSEIGMSYKEICEKHGEVVSSDGYTGSAYYKFDGEPKCYFFRDRNENTYFSDASGKITEPPDNAVCFAILTDVKTLFHKFKGEISISDMEAALGVPIEYSETENGENTNICNFTYGDFDITININKAAGKMISDGDTVLLESVRKGYF